MHSFQASSSWLQVEEFTRITGIRPGGCFGTPTEEDYSGTTRCSAKHLSC